MAYLPAIFIYSRDDEFIISGIDGVAAGVKQIFLLDL